MQSRRAKLPESVWQNAVVGSGEPERAVSEQGMGMAAAIDNFHRRIVAAWSFVIAFPV